MGGSSINVTKSEKKIRFSKNGNQGHTFVACKPPLDSSAEGSFWKVTIDALLIGRWLFLGIIGNLDASKCSQLDPTNYGWATGYSSYQGGVSRSGDDGWDGFIQGECLYFHLKANRLMMFSVQKNKTFTMDIATTAYYIHFETFHVGTKWTLEPLSEDERARFLS